MCLGLILIFRLITAKHRVHIVSVTFVIIIIIIIIINIRPHAESIVVCYYRYLT